MAGVVEELRYVSQYSPVESFSCECEKFIAGEISMKTSPSSPARQMRCMKMGRRAPDRAPVLRLEDWLEVRGRHFFTHIKYARRLRASGGLKKLGLITESVWFNQDRPQFVIHSSGCRNVNLTLKRALYIVLIWFEKR